MLLLRAVSSSVATDSVKTRRAGRFSSFAVASSSHQMPQTSSDDWQQNLVRDSKTIQETTGVDVVPVPVFYPDVTHILGKPVFRRVQDVPGDVDIVNVFRKPSDIPPHLDDIIAKRPKAVWLQSGITHAEAEEQLAKAGIKVVSDRCLKVELQQALISSKM